MSLEELFDTVCGVDRCTVPQDRDLPIHLESNLMQKIPDEIAVDVRVRM